MRLMAFREKFCQSSGRVKPQHHINLNLAYKKSTKCKFIQIFIFM